MNIIRGIKSDLLLINKFVPCVEQKRTRSKKNSLHHDHIRFLNSPDFWHILRASHLICLRMSFCLIFLHSPYFTSFKRMPSCFKKLFYRNPIENCSWIWVSLIYLSSQVTLLPKFRIFPNRLIIFLPSVSDPLLGLEIYNYKRMIIYHLITRKIYEASC